MAPFFLIFHRWPAPQYSQSYGPACPNLQGQSAHSAGLRRFRRLGLGPLAPGWPELAPDMALPQMRRPELAPMAASSLAVAPGWPELDPGMAVVPEA